MGREEVRDLTDLGSPSVQSLVLTVCVSQSQANARAIQGLRKQLLWVSVNRTGRGHRLQETLSGKCGLRLGIEAGKVEGETG